MRFLKYVVLVAAMALPVNVLAHGGGQHVMGTVKSVDTKGLTIVMRDKTELRVLFDEDTKFEKAGAASTVKELVAGARVVVHTAKREGMAQPVAVFVKVGVSERHEYGSWR